MSGIIHWVHAPEIAPARIGLLPKEVVESGSVNLAEAVKDADRVVSALSVTEAMELRLEDEADHLLPHGVHFHWYPVLDRGIPDSNQFVTEFTHLIRSAISRGEEIVFHCHYGLGRSPLLAGMALLISGIPLPEVMKRMGEARGHEIPETDRQRLWLKMFSETLSA